MTEQAVTRSDESLERHQGQHQIAPSLMRSVVSYKVGGHLYPVRTVRDCPVCNSTYRLDMEEMIVLGKTYGRILRALPQGHQITVESLNKHYSDDHMPLGATGARRVLQERANEVGRSMEEHLDAVVDGVALSRLVVEKAFEAVASGEQKVTLKDGLDAAKFLSTLGEYDQGGLDQSVWVEAIMAYLEETRTTMTDEQFADFGRRLDSNPVLRALAARFDESTSEPGTQVSGELVASQIESEDV